MFKVAFLLLIVNTAVAQQYDSLYIERTKVDDNNSIYTVGKEYLFDFEVIINDTLQTVTTEGSNQFSLSAVDSDSVQNFTIPLSIEKPKFLRRTNRRQTEIVYTYSSNELLYKSHTGGVENEVNTWIHPPRFGFFKCLETCPFPYIKVQAEKGESWEDQMVIGEHWSDDLWGVWDGSLLLNYRYTFVESNTLVSNFGDLECKVIEAVAVSDIGTSRLRAHYSPGYGFVKLEYTLFSGIKVTLTLIDLIES